MMTNKAIENFVFKKTVKIIVNQILKRNFAAIFYNDNIMSNY